MVSILELAEKIFTLTSNVDGLIKDIDKLDELVRDHHERIVRLESRDELLAEKAKSASLSAVLQTNHALIQKIGFLEEKVRKYGESRNIESFDTTEHGGGGSVVDTDPSQAPSLGRSRKG